MFCVILTTHSLRMHTDGCFATSARNSDTNAGVDADERCQQWTDILASGNRQSVRVLSLISSTYAHIHR